MQDTCDAVEKTRDAVKTKYQLKHVWLSYWNTATWLCNSKPHLLPRNLLPRFELESVFVLLPRLKPRERSLQSKTMSPRVLKASVFLF